MLSAEIRQKIVDEAMTWVTAKTPYRGWSAKKGCGADCGQIIAAVFCELGLIPKDIALPKDYRIDVAQHRASTDYVDLVALYMREIPEAETLPGDVVVYKFKGQHAYAHGAIIVKWSHEVIDAQLHGGVRVRHGINQPAFVGASKKFFTLREEFTELHIDAVATPAGVSTRLEWSM
jgi:hypothetical protein